MEDLFVTYSEDFYCRKTLAVAQDLLGARLCRRLEDGRLLSGAILEVEAYTQDDPACHAARGRTKRTAVMFGPPGHAYVYFIYGMYFCLNVVTEPVGVPGAVLIRAVAAEGADGPGKLCRAWQIDASYNGLSLTTPESALWIARGKPPKSRQIGTSGRVGISVAQERPWRFFIKDHPGVSARAPARKGRKDEG